MLMESDEKFGFVVMDGNGALFGTLSGDTREVLHKLSAEHPKVNVSGPQAALLYHLVEVEWLQIYLSKAGELATHYPSTRKPNVTGMVFAGSADFQATLIGGDLFDTRLIEKVVNVVEVSCGEEKGFSQVVELLSDILAYGKFTRQKHLLEKYYDEVRQRTGKYVSGVNATMNVLESKSGAVKTLIVWDKLDINRYVMKNSSTGETVIKYLNKEQEGNTENFKELEVEEKMSLLEWLANEYRRFGCELELVTENSWVGYPFCKGRGIGGILQNQIDLEGGRPSSLK